MASVPTVYGTPTPCSLKYHYTGTVAGTKQILQADLIDDAKAGPLRQALSGNILAAFDAGIISLYLTPIAPAITDLAAIASFNLIAVDGETSGAAILEIRFNHTIDR